MRYSTAPWTKTDVKIDAGVVRGNLIRSFSTGEPVALVICGPAEDANSRLIEAAPQLLAACQHLHARLSAWLDLLADKNVDVSKDRESLAAASNVLERFCEK